MLNDIESEIIIWYNDNGYDYVCVLFSEEIRVFVKKEMPHEDVLKFNDEFDCSLKFLKNSYDDLGNGGTAKRLCGGYCNDEWEFHQYSFSQPSFEKFKGHYQEWLDNHGIDGNLSFFSNQIMLVSKNVLSDSQIKDLEAEFKLKGINIGSFPDLNMEIYLFDEVNGVD